MRNAAQESKPHTNAFEVLSKSNKTKDRIVVVALNLISDNGIDRISLRNISEAAGSSNTGAAQYHFGSKLELIRYILNIIEDSIWRPAEAILQDAALSRAPIRKLLMIGLHHLKISPLQSSYELNAARFLAICAVSSSIEIREMANQCSYRYLSLFKRAIEMELPNIPKVVFDCRWQIFITEAILGEMHRNEITMGKSKSVNIKNWLEKHWIYLADLLDYTEAGFTAPTSDWKKDKAEWLEMN